MNPSVNISKIILYFSIKISNFHSPELRPHFVKIAQVPCLSYAGRSPPLLYKGERPAFLFPEPLSEP
jgi:hypothetical protein